MNQSSKLWRRILTSWQLYVMMLPAILFVLIFIYKPMGGLVIAFKDYSFKKGIWGSDWVGLENFGRLFSSYWFPIILRNTLTISTLSLVLGTPAPILLALILNEVKNKHLRKTIQTVSYAPHFISTVVICGMILLFLNPETGIINKAINFLGFEPIAFMQSVPAFKWVYVLSGIWQSTGWGAIIYFAALSAVDKELLEAAEIDGASRFQRVRYINFPVLIPTIVTLFILSCGSLLSVGYEKVFLLQTPTNINGSEVISPYVYKMGLIKQDFEFSTATGLFNSVINCCILVLANFLSRRVGENSLW